jgi:AcrR family transcriptional regulator
MRSSEEKEGQRGGRRYVLKLRARHQEETRRRIVQATGELHRSIGPAKTTVSAIAERAGVERETVYRHFPDMGSLIGACGARFLELVEPPDPEQLATTRDPMQRLKVGLEAVYDYYRRAGPGLDKVLRDRAVLPAHLHLGDPVLERIAAVESVLLEPWANGNSNKVRAAVGHATAYWTWHSLVLQRGLSQEETVELVLTFLNAVIDGRNGRTRR